MAAADAGPPAAETARPAERARLRLVTFNIRHGAEAGGKAVRPDALAAACAGFDADVLALQEVDRFTSRAGGADLATVVADATGLTMAFGNAIPGYKGGEYGNALLVRGMLDGVQVLELPRRQSPGQGHEPRVAVVGRATLERAPVTLSVAATHLAVHRRVNAPQVRAVFEAAAALPAPRVVIGDLNRTPRELARLRVLDGYVLAGGGPTFPLRRPVMRIDHVAVERLAIESVEVVRTAVSDHRAVIVTVRPLPEAP